MSENTQIWLSATAIFSLILFLCDTDLKIKKEYENIHNPKTTIEMLQEANKCKN